MNKKTQQNKNVIQNWFARLNLNYDLYQTKCKRWMIKFSCPKCCIVRRKRITDSFDVYCHRCKKPSQYGWAILDNRNVLIANF